MTHAALIERLTRRAVRSVTVAGMIDETFESPQLLAREAATAALAEHDDVPVTVFEHEDGAFSVSGNTHAVLMSPTTTDVVALDLDETLASMKVGEFWGLLTSVSSTDPDHVLFVTGRNKDKTPKGVAYDVARNKAAIASFKGYNGRFVKLDQKDIDGGAKAKIATKLKGQSFEDFTESVDEGMSADIHDLDAQKESAVFKSKRDGVPVVLMHDPSGRESWVPMELSHILRTRRRALTGNKGLKALKIVPDFYAENGKAKTGAAAKKAIAAMPHFTSESEARDSALQISKINRSITVVVVPHPRGFDVVKGPSKKAVFSARAGGEVAEARLQRFDSLADMVDSQPRDYSTFTPEPGTALAKVYVGEFGTLDEAAKPKGKPRKFSTVDHLGNKKIIYLWQDGSIRLATAAGVPMHPNAILASVRQDGSAGHAKEFRELGKKMAKLGDAAALKALKAAVYGNHKVAVESVDEAIKPKVDADGNVTLDGKQIAKVMQVSKHRWAAKDYKGREVTGNFTGRDAAVRVAAGVYFDVQRRKAAGMKVDEAFRPLPNQNEGYGFWGTLYTDVEMSDGYEFAGSYDTTKAHRDASMALAGAMLEPTPVRVRNVLDSKFGRHLANEVMRFLPPKVTAAAMKKALTKALAVKWVAKTLNSERKLAPFVVESLDTGKDLAEDTGDVPIYLNINSYTDRTKPGNYYMSSATAAAAETALDNAVTKIYPKLRKMVVAELKRDRKLTQALKADGFKLSESTVPQGDPTMTVRIIDDESSLAEAEGYYEGIEEDLAIDELEDALATAIGSAGNEHLPAIEQFEALCNEGEYAAAQDVGIGLLESILDEEQLDELKKGFKFNAGQRALIARRRKKAKTGTQKIELRKRRKEARKSINKLKRKRFRKMNKARLDRRRKQLGNSTEPTNPHAELFAEMAALGFTHAILIEGEEPLFSKDAAHAAEIAEDDDGEVVELEEGKVPPQFLSKQKGKGKANGKKKDDDEDDDDDTDESVEESTLEVTEDCYDDEGNLDVLGESAAAKMARAVTKFLRKHPRTGHGELATRFGIGQARAREVIDTVAKLGKAKGDAGSFEMVAVRVMDKLMQAGAKPAPAKGARVVMKPKHKVMKTGRMESDDGEGDENLDEAGYGGITKGGDGKPAHGAAGKAGDKTSGPKKGDAMRGPKPSYKGQTGAIKDDVKEAIENAAGDNNGHLFNEGDDGVLTFAFESRDEADAFLADLDENDLLDFEIEARLDEETDEDAVRVSLTLAEGAYEYSDGDDTKVTTHPGVKGKGAAPTAGAKKLKRSPRQDKNASEDVNEAYTVSVTPEKAAVLSTIKAEAKRAGSTKSAVADGKWAFTFESEKAGRAFIKALEKQVGHSMFSYDLPEADESDDETVEEATVVVPREEAEALIEAARACGVQSNDARVEVANSQVTLHCSPEQAEKIQQRLAS